MIWVYIPAVFAVLITEHVAFMLLVLGAAGVGAAYGWWDDRRLIRHTVDRWIALASPTSDSQSWLPSSRGRGSKSGSRVVPMRTHRDDRVLLRYLDSVGCHRVTQATPLIGFCIRAGNSATHLQDIRQSGSAAITTWGAL